MCNLISICQLQQQCLPYCNTTIKLPWIRHNESASTCSGICLWISYGNLKHFTYACLPAWHRDMDMGIRAIGQHSTEMPITATVWGFWLLVVSVWLGKSLPWLPRLDSRAEQANERANEPLPGGKAHSISVIAGCPNPWRPQVSIARQRFAIQVASRRRLRQHQHQRLILFVVVVIKTRAEIYDSVRIQLQFGLSVFLSVCPGIGSELGLLLFLLLLLLLFVLLFAGWQWKWCNHIAHGSCHCAFACCLQNNWFCVHILDTNKQRTHTETHSHTHTLTLSLCVPRSPTLSAEAVENFWIKFNKAKAF